ncbi:MAG: hypothetical protein Kow00105_17130 [Phycisphaeraceae bacterium]
MTLMQGGQRFSEELNAYCSRHDIDMVIPADMRTTRALVRARDAIREAQVCALPASTTLDRLHNKWTFYQFLRQHDLPTPETSLVKEIHDLEKLVIDFPVLAKPVEGENGEGIWRADTHADLVSGYAQIQQKHPGPYLIQRYLAGRDIDISLLADHGKMVAWSIQQKDDYSPGTLHFLDHEEVLDVARRIVEACGYHGVAHMDMRCDEQGRLYAIELNPRFWGSLIWSYWAGVNFPDLLIRMTREERISQPITARTGPCTYFGVSPRHLVKTLLRGRFIPEELPPSSQQAWRTNHLDPVPHLYRRFERLFGLMPKRSA